MKRNDIIRTTVFTTAKTRRPGPHIEGGQAQMENNIINAAETAYNLKLNDDRWRDMMKIKTERKKIECIQKMLGICFR